ncbi:unnamed protein product [Pieris macdunnoughi]|uniref:Uncharacterized protein n=1 Tax=Pieris macdunnoughi TaxID=345717 RepID=A0A821YAQ6_9NEOP|nr:unnamed protein product [Pieris macdunnoughi]
MRGESSPFPSLCPPHTRIAVHLLLRCATSSSETGAPLPPAPPATTSPRFSSLCAAEALARATKSVSASDVVEASEEKCLTPVELKESEVKSEVSVGADVASAVASEEDDCVIVSARDADDRSDSGVSGVRSGGSASSVEEWRGMAHGYGGGPPPPLLHLPPPPPSLYAGEMLWKQRYQPPLHAPLHHAIADDYLAAANFDRERHERLLRERRDQEQREHDKQQKEKERERIEREREREREKQEREEKERREQENAASKLVSRHFEESLRLANQKRERNMSWSLLNNIAPNRGGSGPEHERLRAQERAYYSPPAHPPDRLSQTEYTQHNPHAPHSPHSQHTPRHTLSKSDKQPPLQGLPKSEPNFASYNYPLYRYDKLKDQHLPAPPPLVPEKNSVIVKHDAKQIHLEQKHPYPSKPRSEPSPHYLSRPYRTGLSPHAPPHPHPALQTQPHAALPAQDKNRRLYQPQPPQRSPAGYYQTAPPVKPKVSSPAPPHIYGKPSNSPSPAHFGIAVEPPLQLSKAELPPVPYPPPSAYSPALRTRPPR